MIESLVSEGITTLSLAERAAAEASLERSGFQIFTSCGLEFAIVAALIPVVEVSCSHNLGERLDLLARIAAVS